MPHSFIHSCTRCIYVMNIFSDIFSRNLETYNEDVKTVETPAGNLETFVEDEKKKKPKQEEWIDLTPKDTTSDTTSDIKKEKFIEVEKLQVLEAPDKTAKDFGVVPYKEDTKKVGNLETYGKSEGNLNVTTYDSELKTDLKKIKGDVSKFVADTKATLSSPEEIYAANKAAVKAIGKAVKAAPEKIVSFMKGGVKAAQGVANAFDRMSEYNRFQAEKKLVRATNEAKLKKLKMMQEGYVRIQEDNKRKKIAQMAGSRSGLSVGAGKPAGLSMGNPLKTVKPMERQGFANPLDTGKPYLPNTLR